MLGRWEFTEAKSAMVLMMMLMMVLRGRRGLSHATHQAEGTANASTTASENSARRHRPAVLKHPEEPKCDVGLSHALVPCRKKRALRPFPALPAVHLSCLSNSRTCLTRRENTLLLHACLLFNKRGWELKAKVWSWCGYAGRTIREILISIS